SRTSWRWSSPAASSPRRTSGSSARNSASELGDNTMKTTRFAFVALLASLATAALSAPAPAPSPGAYRVVVNSANGASSMSREDVARLFLKKLTAWPGGQAAQPVDQSKQSAARKAFSQAVLSKDVSA